MQNDIKKCKRKAAVISAFVMIGLLGICLAVILYSVIMPGSGEVSELGAALICGGWIAAVLVGVALALRQRLKEIEGGEEEDARKY